MMKMPMEPNDELLCAYLDGELDAATRAEAEQVLARDPGAQARLARMRRADERLRAAFPLQPAADDDALAARIRSYGAPAAAATAARSADTVTPLRRPAETARRAHRPWRLARLAAALGAVAVGLVLRLGSAPATPAMTAFDRALDAAASGASVPAGAVALQPVLSFRAGDGRYCRVYEQRGEQGATEGLACRGERGWQVLTEVAASAVPGALQPAGGSAEIDALMNRLGGEPALDAAAEQALIARHWQPAR